MNAKLRIQDSLDLMDGISSLEEELQLSTDRIMDCLNNKVNIEKKRRFRKTLVLCNMSAVIIFTAIINWKSIYTYASELLSKFIIYDGGDTFEYKMLPIDITWPETMDEYGYYIASKNYSSLEKVSEDLDVTFLGNKLAWEKEFDNKVSVWLPVHDINLAEISISCFAVGDLKDIRLSDNGAISYRQGENYDSSVNLTVRFLVNGIVDHPINFKNNFQTASYGETYISAGGREVKIYDLGKYGEPWLNAVFYDGNMEYTVSGRVKMWVLKKIIDAFE